MNYLYKPHQIDEFLQREKCLPPGDTLELENHPLTDFKTTDFRDFINQTAKLWNIDLGWNWEGGLF